MRPLFPKSRPLSTAALLYLSLVLRSIKSFTPVRTFFAFFRNRNQGRPKYVNLWIATLVAATLVPAGCALSPTRSTDHDRKAVSDRYHVREVIDGDTFYLDDGEKVRLIGIDAPETPNSYKQRNFYYGEEARDYLKRLIESQDVILEFDQDERDQYGRLLAYVWLDDSVFVNAHLIEQGYAKVVTFPPNTKYHDLLHKLEATARKNHRGVWKK